MPQRKYSSRPMRTCRRGAKLTKAMRTSMPVVVAALASMLVSPSAKGDGVPPVLPDPPDARCAMAPADFAISDALATYARAAHDTTLPRCGAAWMAQAGDALTSIASMTNFAYQQGKEDGVRLALRTSAARAPVYDQPSSPAASPAVDALSALAAGLKSFAAHPLGPGAQPHATNCTGTIVAGHVYTTCQ